MNQLKVIPFVVCWSLCFMGLVSCAVIDMNVKSPNAISTQVNQTCQPSLKLQLWAGSEGYAYSLQSKMGSCLKSEETVKAYTIFARNIDKTNEFDGVNADFEGSLPAEPTVIWPICQKYAVEHAGYYEVFAEITTNKPEIFRTQTEIMKISPGMIEGCGVGGQTVNDGGIIGPDQLPRNTYGRIPAKVWKGFVPFESGYENLSMEKALGYVYPNLGYVYPNLERYPPCTPTRLYESSQPPCAPKTPSIGTSLADEGQ